MKEHLATLLAGGRLSEDAASAAMGTIMDGEATAAQIGAFLAAMAVRGEAEDEVVGFAKTMRSRAPKIRGDGAVDTCGTGGDRSGTFNISTLASLVVAACGQKVAKHGNRSASSQCGSADVLEALGVRLDPGVETVQRCLDELGWAFLFAPAFHAATRHAVGPRKEIGVRTAFNLLGPLTNPACPRAQVVGISRAQDTVFLARCLGRMGLERAWVAHGSGLDEITLAGETQIAEWNRGEVREMVITPEDAGLRRAGTDQLLGGDAAHNASIARAVLEGESGPRRDVVLLNAAAVLVVSERAQDLREGAAQAAEAVDSGKASTLLQNVAKVTNG